eukprot:TRINITY_DN22603_c0_g1_i1.p1 TRINITY_DN22603_c0_g1~~TRINITY_DN22603_c0_g1_i1.p1  ORF type:complete len:827 (+),score=161.77 TRINITY_DN22603_c0_g1_i1:148-2628(+)
MGCGASAGGLPAHFRYTPTDQEFLKTLDKQELKDKKLLLQYYRLEKEGTFVVTDEFRELVRRKGVPERYRWRAWRALTGWSILSRPGDYEKILGKVPEKAASDRIDKDIDRTFPYLEEFDAQKRNELLNLLRANASLFPEVGYCQGLNFVTGFLLLCADRGPDSSREAFFLLVQLMMKYRMNLLFCENLPLLKLHTFQFNQLFSRIFPDVHAHFSDNLITPELYLTRWFLSLFSQALPVAEAARVWDLIVCDGIQAVVLVGLAIIKLLKAKLLKDASTEGILHILSLKDAEPPSGNSIVKAALEIEHHLPSGSLGDGTEIRPRKLFAEWEVQCPEEVADFRKAEAEICNSRPNLSAFESAPSVVATAAGQRTTSKNLPAIDSPSGGAAQSALRGSADLAEDQETEAGGGVHVPAIEISRIEVARKSTKFGRIEVGKRSSSKRDTEELLDDANDSADDKQPGSTHAASAKSTALPGFKMKRPQSTGCLVGRLESGGPLHETPLWSSNLEQGTWEGGAAAKKPGRLGAQTLWDDPGQRWAPGNTLMRGRPGSPTARQPDAAVDVKSQRGRYQQAWEVSDIGIGDEGSSLEGKALRSARNSRGAISSMSTTGTSAAAGSTGQSSSESLFDENLEPGARSTWPQEATPQVQQAFGIAGAVPPRRDPVGRKQRVFSAHPKRPSSSQQTNVDGEDRRARSESPVGEKGTTPCDAVYSEGLEPRRKRNPIPPKEVMLIDLDNEAKEERSLAQRREIQRSAARFGVVGYYSVGARQAWDQPAASDANFSRPNTAPALADLNNVASTSPMHESPGSKLVKILEVLDGNDEEVEDC